jgi:hypothetical protein
MKPIGGPGVMTILSQELAMNGPPAAEVLCCSFLAHFVLRKSYSTSFCVALLHTVAVVSWQPQLPKKLVE